MANRLHFVERDIMSPHSVTFNVENGRVVYVLSGVFIIHSKGASQDWLHEQISLSIPIYGLPPGMGLHIEQWAPYFGLNAIYNENVANNSGHAVDSYAISSREIDARYGQQGVVFLTDIAIRDIDAWLYRIGFHVTLKGVLRPPRPIQ